MEEARRADVDLLSRKASKEEVTPVPDIKAIVSALSDDKVETKMTDSTDSATRYDDVSKNELEIKMANKGSRSRPPKVMKPVTRSRPRQHPPVTS